MNTRQSFGHSRNSSICRARWDCSITVDMIQDEERIRDMQKAFIQSQCARGAEAKTGHRSQDIEFQGCRMTIMPGSMNAEDNACRRAAPGCDFEPIDIRRNASGKRKSLHETCARYVRGDHCAQNTLRQNSLNSGGGQRDVRHR